MSGNFGAETGSWPRPTGKLAGRKEQRSRPWATAAAAAALFALGAYQGYRWSSPEVSPVAYEAGRLVATGELESVLYDPALGGREEGPTAGDPFTGPANETCRRFADGPVSGVACRRDGDWRVMEMRQK